MVWQDILVAVVNIVFAYALIPQVVKGFKDRKKNISLQTGFLNALGMYAMAIAFFSLSLFYSGIMGIVNATMWLVLFLQSVFYK